MILEAGVKIQVNTPAETPVVLMLRPQGGAGQNVIASELRIEPLADIREYQDSFGNLCQRVVLAPGASEITGTCTVDAPDHIDVGTHADFTLVQDLPDDVLQYLLQSRYCQSDMPEVLQLASKIVRKAQPGYDQVEAIRAWIRKHLKYKYGVSNANTSALETAKKRAGVCRDFSHLGIALCRALRIPARMVVGYLHELDPMDLHAWFEAYVGGRWYTFDATQPEPRGNRVVLAYGRDAADVAQLSEYGPLKMGKQEVWVRAGS
jgi:transglutaminase-like putative cysteine protease